MRRKSIAMFVVATAMLAGWSMRAAHEAWPDWSFPLALAGLVVISGLSEWLDRRIDTALTDTDPRGVQPRCSAHGDAACDLCSLNGPCDECVTYDEYGMHWDTCPNRVRTYADRDRRIGVTGSSAEPTTGGESR